MRCSDDEFVSATTEHCYHQITVIIVIIIIIVKTYKITSYNSKYLYSWHVNTNTKTTTEYSSVLTTTEYSLVLTTTEYSLVL